MADPTQNPTIVTKRASGTVASGDGVSEGEHTVSSLLVRITREWQPENKAAQRFKDDVIQKMEQVLNNTSGGSEGGSGGDSEGGGSGGGGAPGLFFDTGYIYIAAKDYHPKWYSKQITHNLGQVPSRFTVFFSNVAEPKLNIDLVQVVSPFLVKDNDGDKVGFMIRIDSTNKFTISAPGTHVHQRAFGEGKHQDGYFRVMVWR